MLIVAASEMLVCFSFERSNTLRRRDMAAKPGLNAFGPQNKIKRGIDSDEVLVTLLFDVWLPQDCRSRCISALHTGVEH